MKNTGIPEAAARTSGPAPRLFAPEAPPHLRPGLGRLALAALASGLTVGPLGAAQPYPIVDPGQIRCFDDRSEIAPPKAGEAFYGQDAQFQGRAASYTLSTDGRTVHDNVTGLTWQRSPDTDGDGRLDRADKLAHEQALALPARLNASKFGGFTDWRLPTIKELYSLFDGRGTDPSGPRSVDTACLTPYIDTNFFQFAYGDEAAGERVIDSQYASCTMYVNKSFRGFGKLFGVNFADGRIKGYDMQMPGGAGKTFFVQCVRGNPEYGKNDFKDNGDQTVADMATGLTWTKADSGRAMNWRDALAWVREKNAERHLGHDDWRLPDVKELQSIVDYTRSPDTTHSAAIDPVFTCSGITNEGGKADFPCYWTGTTHGGFLGGAAAMYVAFGRAAGWLPARVMAGGAPVRRGPAAAAPPTDAGGEYHFTDVHGAGAQRSDPKSGDPAEFPHGRGPQGDVIRIFNHVRLVRGGEVVSRTASAPSAPTPAAPASAMRPSKAGAHPGASRTGSPGTGLPVPPTPPVMAALDANSDGAIDRREIANAAAALKTLDKNGDGQLTRDETMPPRPGGGEAGMKRQRPDGG